MRQLQAEADAWLVRYNRRRRNHGDFMRGRTPLQVLEANERHGRSDAKSLSWRSPVIALGIPMGRGDRLACSIEHRLL